MDAAGSAAVALYLIINGAGILRKSSREASDSRIADMNRSGIDPGLLPLRFLRPVLWRPLLPIMNAILRILPHSFGREIRMKKAYHPCQARRDDIRCGH